MRFAPTPFRLVVSLLAALLLTGCGAELRPGVAATVNGTTIDQSEVDQLAHAACDYTKLSREQSEGGGTSPTLGLAGLRSSLVDSLIRIELTETKAEELDVTVSDADVADAASRGSMPEGLDESDEELITEFFRDAARAQLLQGLIGAKLQNRAVTSAQELTQADIDAAADYLAKYAEKADVEVNPRYGRWTGSSVEQSSGSLSDPVETTAASVGLPGQAPDTLSALPVSQKCG